MTIGQLIDSELERLVAEAVLSGHISLDELRPFVAEHVTDPILRNALQAVARLPRNGAKPALGDVVALLRERGVEGPLGATLKRLHDDTPSTSASYIRQVAADLAELARKRALCQSLNKLEAEIRTGAIDHGDACASLRSYIESTVDSQPTVGPLQLGSSLDAAVRLAEARRAGTDRPVPLP